MHVNGELTFAVRSNGFIDGVLDEHAITSRCNDLSRCAVTELGETLVTRRNENFQFVGAQDIKSLVYHLKNLHPLFVIELVGETPLCKPSFDRCPELKFHACHTLVNLNLNSAHAVLQPTEGDLALIKLWVQLLEMATDAVKEVAATTLRLLADDSSAHAHLEMAGSAVALVRALRSGTESLKLPVVTALYHLSLGDVEIAAAGAVPVLVELLTDSDVDVVDQAVAALRDISCNQSHRADLVKAGAIPPLVRLLKDGADGVQGDAAAVLCNLVNGNADNTAATVAAGAAPLLVQLLIDGTDDAQDCAARTVMSMVYHEEQQDAIVEAGVIAALVQLLSDGPEDAKVFAAGALWSLAASNYAYVQSMIAEGAIPSLVQVLSDTTDNTQEYAAGALKSIASDKAARTAIIAAGAIPPLVQLLSEGTENVKEQSVGVLEHLVRCNSRAVVEVEQSFPWWRGSMKVLTQCGAVSLQYCGTPPITMKITER
jgi:hypothetical protein